MKSEADAANVIADLPLKVSSDMAQAYTAVCMNVAIKEIQELHENQQPMLAPASRRRLENLHKAAHRFSQAIAELERDCEYYQVDHTFAVSGAPRDLIPDEVRATARIISRNASRCIALHSRQDQFETASPRLTTVAAALAAWRFAINLRATSTREGAFAAFAYRFEEATTGQEPKDNGRQIARALEDKIQFNHALIHIVAEWRVRHGQITDGKLHKGWQPPDGENL